MRIVETHYIIESDTGYESDGKGSLSVAVFNDDGKKLDSLTIRAGEPEDAVFFRDLDGAYSIEDLMRLAYEAGKRGESYDYEFIDEYEAEKEDE